MSIGDDPSNYIVSNLDSRVFNSFLTEYGLGLSNIISVNRVLRDLDNIRYYNKEIINDGILCNLGIDGGEKILVICEW